jgi:PAS domain-containing protein
LWEWDAIEDRSAWSDELRRIDGQAPGFSPTDAEFRALVHPDDKDLIDGGGAERPHGLRRYDDAYRIVRPDGEIRHMHARRDVIRDEHGMVTHMFDTTQDVTELFQAEIARREAQELFETAFSQAPIGMALIGLDGRWMKVNRHRLPSVCGRAAVAGSPSGVSPASSMADEDELVSAHPS